MLVGPRYLKLGMTEREVLEITGAADDVNINVWSNETGPFFNSITWEFDSETTLPSTFKDKKANKGYLYFKERVLAGYDIFSDNPRLPIRSLVGDASPIIVGDTQDNVILAYGNPQRIYPEGWDEVKNPEYWEYRDQFDNILTVIRFRNKIVVGIDT